MALALASYCTRLAPLFRGMLVLSVLGGSAGLAQTKVEVYTTAHAPAGTGSTVRMRVKEVKRTDEGIVVTFAGEHGAWATQTISGLTGAAFEAALLDYRPGSIHELTIKGPDVNEQLRVGGPFRGLVNKSTSSFFTLLTITDFEGRQRFASEFGPAVPMMEPQLQVLLTQFEHGKIYEFPDAWEKAWNGGQKKAAPKKLPVKDAFLSRYVGTWEGAMEGKPQSRLQAHYVWNEAGTALWRELSFWPDRNDQKSPVRTAVLISYDPLRKAYAERNPSDLAAEPLWYEWNPTLKQLSSKTTDQANGLARINLATFVTDDRIEWKTTRVTAGSTDVISSGYYERIKD